MERRTPAWRPVRDEWTASAGAEAAPVNETTADDRAPISRPRFAGGLTVEAPADTFHAALAVIVTDPACPFGALDVDLSTCWFFFRRSLEGETVVVVSAVHGVDGGRLRWSAGRVGWGPDPGTGGGQLRAAVDRGRCARPVPDLSPGWTGVVHRFGPVRPPVPAQRSTELSPDVGGSVSDLPPRVMGTRCRTGRPATPGTHNGHTRHKIVDAG